MNNYNYQSYSNENPQIRKQLKITPKQNFDNSVQNDWSQPEFKINVYNYFLDDFPKTYLLSKNDTIENLKQLIVKNTSNIQIADIKNFKDENGCFVKNNTVLRKFYKNNSKLNMEIFFNQNLKITTNNKQIEYFMQENTSNDFNEIFKSIINFHNNIKGGKIIVGVQSDGFIKGINIPEQDIYKEDFLNQFRTSINQSSSNNIFKDVEISFFRVKGQNRDQYNFHDHKKIMIIKVKGKNKQDNIDNSQDSTDDNDEHTPVNSFTENLKSLSPNNLNINDVLVKQNNYPTAAEQKMNKSYNLFQYSVNADFMESLFNQV